ncbi:MAG: GNAT family N-acetyltransferase [Gammaproteobacteria bacterium]|nr:GNAT family N-acetyltransferase [Gammaproteobacteria bacterium]MBU1775059.1 GNAT family N-acetyltransferase [Gammaproteobacteria bacterium]MBU1969742.1 GNAT family N-acetyltransferase [Gammaproteobacteria bacterium]
MKFSLREYAASLRELLSRACFWRWEIANLPVQNGSPYNIIYTGRKTHREWAKALLGADGEVCSSQKNLNISSQSALVCDLPFPGALRVPQTLRFTMPLGRPIEEITAGFESELRRRLRKCWGRYRMQQILDDAEIDRADREMLQPYASARHGMGASQVDPDEVRRIAQKFGRLELVLLEDEVVACQTGCVITRAGKRYWSSIRFGYPESIYSDPKRLNETNSINFYLALEWAIDNGFDYYDMGVSLGRPEDNLLQWKKRWGGALDKMGIHGYFYVRLPKTGTAQFLWDAPLFAIEHQKISLHLGLPSGPNDDEVMIRYRLMSFGGLFKVYLHCAGSPSEGLLESLRSQYSRQKSPPDLVILPSS